MMLPLPQPLYESESQFNKSASASPEPPKLGLSFSGGGHRSAAVAIGVLWRLNRDNLLRTVDVISAVSGGSYALSWFLLQPFYHKLCHDDPAKYLPQLQNRMFDPGDVFQRYLTANAKPLEADSWFDMFFEGANWLPFQTVLFNLLRPFTWGNTHLRNATPAREMYRHGIQRTFQVFPLEEERITIPAKTPRERFRDRALRSREFLTLTRDDVFPVTFTDLKTFALEARLPSFVLNATVRPPRPGPKVPLRQRIFELGPFGFGSDSSGFYKWEDTANSGWEPGMPVPEGALLRPDFTVSPYATLRNFNTASAISGAALSGTNIDSWKQRFPLWLLNFGLEYGIPLPGGRQKHLYLSDGGHSENLGAYALLRRKCRTVVIVDAGCDPSYTFTDYKKLRDAANKELEAAVTIPGIDAIVDNHKESDASDPVFEGTTAFGKVFYLKPSRSLEKFEAKDQIETVRRYSPGCHHRFPQESTIDQVYSAAQFEAYRALGYLIADKLLKDFPSL